MWTRAGRPEPSGKTVVVINAIAAGRLDNDALVFEADVARHCDQKIYVLDNVENALALQEILWLMYVIISRFLSHYL